MIEFEQALHAGDALLITRLHMATEVETLRYHVGC